METKVIYKSRTIWGLILIAIGGALQQEIGIPNAIGRVVILIGFLLAVVGRYLADKPLTV